MLVLVLVLLLVLLLALALVLLLAEASRGSEALSLLPACCNARTPISLPAAG